ncbi:MAG: hypothetical protein C0475_06185 [Planctomyces sp.]|nr:hypothetical protein [Planctomyces sp.]MBA4120292.1 hypothetical protein [Isosphaera sp.]
MPLRVHNTLTRRLEPFTPRDPGRVTFYTCGPTVYDDAHVGNFRSFLAADLLRRVIQSPLIALENSPAAQNAAAGQTHRRVIHAMNITDVGHMTDDAEGGEAGEDRMAVAGRRLQEAKKAGALPPGVEIDPRDPRAIAAYYAQRFLADARRLGMLVAMDAQREPALMPRASEAVPGMIRVIQRLERAGFAYARGEPGVRAVYFDVQRFAPYGVLSGNTLEQLRAGAGGRVSDHNQSQKRHPADFLLWKEDPRHIMRWPSPWGEGYPGWHIECTVMSLTATRGRGLDLDALTLPGGEPLIDVHSGGEDNIFPHHECELAQSCCAFNADPARGTFAGLWFHPRHLFINGQKMSKSKGNFFTIAQLTERGHEPAAIRLALIGTHYRSNADLTEQLVRDCHRAVERWRRVMDAGAPPAGARPEPVPTSEPVLRAFAAALEDDLNIAGAIGAVNTWVSEIGSPTPRHAAVLGLIDDVLGVLSLERPKPQDTEIGVFLGGLSPDQAVIAKLIERREARKAKDFGRSDQIRDQLAAMGFNIKDAPGGKVEVSRRP